MRGAAAAAAFVAVVIALPLAAEALFPWKTPADSHPDLRTNTARWYDYLRQASEGGGRQNSNQHEYTSD